FANILRQNHYDFSQGRVVKGPYLVQSFADLSLPASKLVHQQIRQVAGLQQRPVERRHDVRLEPRLLVKPDLQVRQEHQLRLFLGVRGSGGSPIVTERLLQQILPVRRRSRCQALPKTIHLGIGNGADVGKEREPTGKLQPNLLEHLAIAALHRIRGSLEWTQIGNRVDHKLQQVQVALLEQFDQLCVH